MTRKKSRIDWYNAANRAADWDAAEVSIETPGFIFTICPSIGVVAGPDMRWCGSLDVPDGRGGIRPLVAPFLANSRIEATREIEAALRRLEKWLSAIFAVDIA